MPRMNLSNKKIKKLITTILSFAIGATIVFFWLNQYLYYTDYGEYYGYEISCPRNSNVALIKVQGMIVTYGDYLYGYNESEEIIESDITSSEKIVRYIDDINKDKNIKAIIIEIDSYGGGPVASEEIMEALKRSEKPTVAVIREGGVSGGYLIATGANRIYASEMSDVGGIGATRSYLDYSQAKNKEGIIYQEISSARYKDTGHPDKELTEEERELLMRDVIEIHEIFVRKITENRNMGIEEIEKLADGSTILGKSAKEKGLIDEIGDIYSAKAWIGNNLNIEPKLCIYQ